MIIITTTKKLEALIDERVQQRLKETRKPRIVKAEKPQKRRYKKHNKGGTMPECINAVMVDGKPRNTEQVVRDLRKIYSNPQRNSVATCLCKMVVDGDLERVNEGIYRKVA